MGETYKISCKCGYIKEVNIGGGLGACNINMINTVFIEEKRKEFTAYYENKEVQSFFAENELSLCDTCKEIMTIAVLKAKITNNQNLEIRNDCSACRSKVNIITDSIRCPKCGQKMSTEEIGHWD